MVRKALIVAISAITKDPIYQVVGSTVLLTTCFGMQLYLAPYGGPLFNWLEALSLLSLIVTQAVSLMYLRASTLHESQINAAITGQTLDAEDVAAGAGSLMLDENAATVILILVNALTLVVLLHYYIKIRRKEMKGRATCRELLFDLITCSSRGKKEDRLDAQMQEVARRLSGKRTTSMHQLRATHHQGKDEMQLQRKASAGKMDRCVALCSNAFDCGDTCVHGARARARVREREHEHEHERARTHPARVHALCAISRVQTWRGARHRGACAHGGRRAGERRGGWPRGWRARWRRQGACGQALQV